MAQCKDIAEEANQYIDGDLPLRRRISLYFHLVVCKCCRVYLDQMRDTIRAVTVFKPKEAINQDIKSLAQRLREESQK
jgi:predicted anti-sigma-YlaC factor YlaD